MLVSQGLLAGSMTSFPDHKSSQSKQWRVGSVAVVVSCSFNRDIQDRQKISKISLENHAATRGVNVVQSAINGKWSTNFFASWKEAWWQQDKYSTPSPQAGWNPRWQCNKSQRARFKCRITLWTLKSLLCCWYLPVMRSFVGWLENKRGYL